MTSYNPRYWEKTTGDGYTEREILLFRRLHDLPLSEAVKIVGK